MCKIYMESAVSLTAGSQTLQCQHDTEFYMSNFSVRVVYYHGLEYLLNEYSYNKKYNIGSSPKKSSSKKLLFK